MLDVEIQWSILVPHGNKPRSQLGQTLFFLGKVIAVLCIVILLITGVSIFISGTDGDTTITPLQEIKLSLGQTATSSDSTLQVTVYSAQRLTSYTNAINPKKGYIFILIDIEAKNIGLIDKDFPLYNGIYMRDSDANAYEESYPKNDGLNRGTLYAEEHKRGKVLFEIPSTAKDLRFYVKINDNPKEMAIWTIPDKS